MQQGYIRGIEVGAFDFIDGEILQWYEIGITPLVCGIS